MTTKQEFDIAISEMIGQANASYSKCWMAFISLDKVDVELTVRMSPKEISEGEFVELCSTLARVLHSHFVRTRVWSLVMEGGREQ